MFLWCVRDGWRDIYSERGLLPISSSRSQGVPTLTPPYKLVRDASDRLLVPHSAAILSTPSKSDKVVLITWSLSGYTPVVPNCPDRAVLFITHNVTACQSILDHLERTENPWHMLYNTFISPCVGPEQKTSNLLLDWNYRKYVTVFKFYSFVCNCYIRIVIIGILKLDNLKIKKHNDWY